MQAPGDEDLDPLVGIADTRVHHPEVAPGFGFVAGFLKELTVSSRQDILSRIDLSGGKLQENPTKWVTELALEQQLAVVLQGQNHHGPGMNNVFPDRLTVIRQLHPVTLDVQQLALEHRFRTDHGFNQVCIIFQGRSPKEKRPENGGVSITQFSTD